MITEIVLFASVAVNILLIWYAKWLINSYKILSEDILSINELVLEFSEHVKEVYELKTFYGDKALDSLIQHGKELVDKIEELDLLIDEEDSEKETQEN